MDEDNCVFCKILKGEISGEVLMESDNFIVLRDANPRVEGHSLVIPRRHCETFLDLPKELYEEFLETTKRFALKLLEENNAKGYNLIINNKAVAGQVVPHLHLHILPRKDGDGLRVTG